MHFIFKQLQKLTDKNKCEESNSCVCNIIRLENEAIIEQQTLPVALKRAALIFPCV